MWLYLYRLSGTVRLLQYELEVYIFIVYPVQSSYWNTNGKSS